ncbi:septum formation family protein [Arthrobacter caoxuetaonis]|uniref:Septum formation family protein n=1 Tax=Arthrobacter caoxuetaonis TaxID=2886935 RepID=A0A9X1ME07_9MICC|nr:septum formation family protein [Arthrobacter caoxuetaonis]MCC3298299.1 septum formation family protein [Arthrobacter caoxuetaonis]USQ57684.1 septum formation family protein [Arthrobacter caoxuetaonis]
MNPARQVPLARAGKAITAAAFALLLAGCGASVSADNDEPKAGESPAAASAPPEAETVAREEAEEEVSAATVDAVDLKVGDCMAEDPDAEEVDAVDVLPCTQPHDSEVYAAMDMEAGPYPGDEAVDAMAQDFCLAEFQPYIGTDYSVSALDIGYLTPTPTSWTLGNDREILCSAYRVDGEKLSTTVKNSNV